MGAEIGTERATGKAPGLAARRLALDLLHDVLEHRRMLSDALEMRADQVAALAPSDRARAQRLTTETLRHLHRADACLRPMLQRPPAATTKLILRLATVELCQTGGEAHGVVNSAVTLARRDPRAARQAKLVNAVLRRVADEGPDRWAKLTAPARLPAWLRGRAQSAYGARVTAAIEAAHDRGAPVDLTPKDGDAAALAAAVGGRALPTGSVRLGDGPGAVSTLPGYAEGAWWVQDAAAALPARALAAQQGERVLDLCAAPGGKTLQLAAAGAQVTALDISDRRLERLSANLARTGLAAEIVAADALSYAAAPFDAVLLDAPCTATGTIRRHPDLPYLRRKDDLSALVALQAELLDRAVGLLRPGGRLVFCTCSLLAEEGERQAEAALARHSNLTPDPVALDLPGTEADWRSGSGLRLRPDLWPETGGMDGFFIAAFRAASGH
ncbi:MAG: methyltransferase domain-containing protein [Rhodobacteraceae bacterium]|nr:methyltransferase domain-containing protein [Paracoccaceae bacterium]